MSVHRTVLLNETIDGLNLNDKSVVLDCTFGGGGHSLEICQRYPDIKIVALDQDQDVFSNKAKERFKDLGCDISFVNANFRDLDKGDWHNLDGIIFDLGLSSDQLEIPDEDFLL